jgi:hypothetical protein
MPLSYHVRVYNSAGELVRTLFEGQGEASTGMGLASGSFLEGQGSMVLNFGGRLENGSTQLSWDGTNDGGQYVGGGAYTVRVEIEDSFGHSDSWIQGVNVMPGASTQRLEIFNSAGELVVILDSGANSATALTRLGLKAGSSGAFALESGGVDFVLDDGSGSPLYLTWDGRNAAGSFVAPGSYTAQLVDISGGRKVVVTQGFVILAGSKAPFIPLLGPNPLGPQDKTLRLLAGVASGEHLELRLYNAAGELVGAATGAAGSGSLGLQLGPWSGGIYVAVIELREGSALKERKLIKMALIR